MYVDSHCHLSFEGLHERIDDVRAAMAAAQVDRALVICTTLEEFETVHGLALQFDNFWASAGVHPDQEDVQEPSVDDLLQRAACRAWSRSAKPASTTIDSADAASRHAVATRALSGPHPGRRARCQAAGDPHPQRQADTLAILREEGGGAARRCFPLLHRDRRRGPSGAGFGLLYLVLRNFDL